MTDILGFAACAVVIFFAGKKLSYYGDQIAEKSGLGKAWVGLILMATVTSLPELMVGVSSSAIVQSADLAVGDIIGSCTFNLTILAVLDIFVPKRQHLFFVASAPRHTLSAALGLILTSIAGIGLFLPTDIVILPGLGIISLMFIVLYLFSIRIIYTFDRIRRSMETAEPEHPLEGLTLQQLLLRYTGFASIVIVAALFIPYLANGIAESSGLGTSFIGTMLVAASTSLPEIAVSIAAVRIGSIDLALGNLLGSNIFNMLILALDDAFYTKGILLKDASDIHLISVFAALVMYGIAIAGFTIQAPKKKFVMAIDAVLMLIVYILSMGLLFVLSR